MRLRDPWITVAVSACLAASANAQSAPPEIQADSENLDFIKGNLGAAPPGWHLGAASVQGAARVPSGVGAVHAVREDTTGKLAFLCQVVDASPYRGKTLTFRAAVRTDVGLGSMARLLVRIHRWGGTTSFRDDMGNHPITSNAWSFYQIRAPIVSEAWDCR
jgi:hypothetical protein